MYIYSVSELIIFIEVALKKIV